MTREEADINLRNAISEHAQAYGFVEDGEMLDQFAIISCWPNLKDPHAGGYILQFHQVEPPDHVARGLFTQALHILDFHPSTYEEE